MNSTEIVNSIFADLLPQVDSFVQGDFLAVIMAMISIIFIVAAGAKIFEILNMTALDRSARDAFSVYKHDSGTWREPISKRKYDEALFEIETKDFDKENKKNV